MYPKSLKDVDQSVRAAVAIERRIVKRTVSDLLAAGYELAVHDGEEWHERTTDRAKLHAALMETDEDRLFVYKTDGYKGRRDWFGWVFFVYGNDGYNVINDYTINLEEVLKPVNAFADTLE
jgi:subtilisin family serine protease